MTSSIGRYLRVGHGREVRAGRVACMLTVSEDIEDTLDQVISTLCYCDELSLPSSTRLTKSALDMKARADRRLSARSVVGWPQL